MSLIGMPTFLYHVLTQAVAEGQELPNLHKLVLGGEKAPSGMRRKLRALAAQLGAPKVDVLRTYGFTEAKLAWAECPYQEDAGSAGYHIHPDLALIEIVDPKTGEPRGEGEPGEIVFTPLDARGSVVLRYRTGDCIDGGLYLRAVPVLRPRRPAAGRRDFAQLRDPRAAHREAQGDARSISTRLEHVLDNVEHVGTWQVELRKRHDDPLECDELILHVEKADDFREAGLREMLESRFLSELEMHPNRIEFHSVEELRLKQGVGTQLKEQRLVDHRPAALNKCRRRVRTGMNSRKKAQRHKKTMIKAILLVTPSPPLLPLRLLCLFAAIPLNTLTIFALLRFAVIPFHVPTLGHH